MTRSVFLAAVAALLGLAGGARAFHPCVHPCLSHAHGTRVAPQAVQPFAVQPFAVQPFVVQPFVVQPMAVQSFAVQPFAVVPMAAQSTASAEAFNAATVLASLKAACRLVNGGDVGAGGGGGSAGELAALKTQLAAQKTTLDAILADINERRKAEKKEPIGGGGDKPKNNPKIGSAAPRAAEQLAAIDAGLDEIDALQRQLADLRAARRDTPAAPAETPALAGRR